MSSGNGVSLKQAGHKGTQLIPENLCPGTVAASEGGGQDIQGLSDLWGSCGAQGLFHVAHDLLGTRRPGTALWAAVLHSFALHGQSQYVHQELTGGRSHEQAWISLQGEDGVNRTWGVEGRKQGSVQMWKAENNFYHVLQSPRKKILSRTNTRRPFPAPNHCPTQKQDRIGTAVLGDESATYPRSNPQKVLIISNSFQRLAPGG